MQYFSINYSTLKNYIFEQKEKYNLIDIVFLLEHGIINQQQYEELATIVAKPWYNYKSFLEEDKGWYHQQGPLTIIQENKDLLASKKINRLIKKGKQKHAY